MNNIITNEYVKQMAFKYGADLCGVASVDVFSQAPEGFHPTDIFSECKTVIVTALKMPEGTFLGKSKVPYTAANDRLLDELFGISVSMSRELEKHRDAKCIPIPSEPYEYWDAENQTGKGILSLKHSGYLAGLGFMGKNSMLTNRKYGNRIVLGALLIDKIIQADNIDNDIKCVDGCNLCEKKCPVNAISNGSVDQKLCRGNSGIINEKGYFLYTCFECRAVCPNGKGQAGKNRF